MNNIISVLQDVSALVTRGSDVARTEARRMEAQREQVHHGSRLLSARVRRFWATSISVCRTAIMGKANDII
jgi:hypothetical protein